MRRYTLVNNILGWVSFTVAMIVYALTIEPTASFWDCGEFISTAFKLEVGHPPGAPLFNMVGRMFTLFAGDNVEKVAMMVNLMTAFVSALTILFLFWTITHFAKKLLVKDGEELSTGNLIAVMGSGFVGAMAYTFSDTFWFSAVEGEVYGFSSFFTAIIFWAILKWEREADQPFANRWIILIAYLMGLSIGIHLLNLLAIPAIVLVYYFKKYELSLKGAIKALLVSGLILASIIWGIIPGVPRLATYFELMFVNGFGLPFNTGAVFYLVLLIGALCWGIWYTFKKGKGLANMILTSVAVILIGYSSVAMVVIRSSANPPMDQNSPDDVFSLLSYLNREQYGDRPLITGQYYNSPVSKVKDGKLIRVKKNGRYEVVDQRSDYEFDSKTTTFFPRMYSREKRHIPAYKQWGAIEGKRVVTRNMRGEEEVIMKPTFIENLRFFFSYQVNFMYWRYFMWNFAGRQNDIQGHGGVMNGNWISGIPFFDNVRLGDQSLLPDDLKNNPARNKYYFLPFILGLLGMVFQFQAGKKGHQGFWTVMMLFFLTGLAIVIYLNQTPYQPRERDYAYAGSFYAFAIWIGLGVLALYDGLKSLMKATPAAAIASTVCFLAVPTLLAAENWDDHDRSGRYTARDFAYNYLNTCEENAIIFTNGDNDTFPLWYAQEVEGIRTDVRVCNLSYLQTDWYIDQMKRKAYKSDPVPFSMTHDQYVTGKREAVYLFERVKGRRNLKQVMDFVKSENPNTKRIPGYDERIDYMPTRKVYLPVDSTRVLETGTVSEKHADLIVDSMKWDIPGDRSQMLYKNKLMVLDLLENNNWERPMYFAFSMGYDSFGGLDKFFQLDGWAYRLVPIEVKGNEKYVVGRINTDKLYENVMEKFRWGGIDNPDVYLDENNRRMLVNVRNTFGRLALALVKEGQNEKAAKVLDRYRELLPTDRLKSDQFSLSIAQGYYQIGDNEKGNKVVNEIIETSKQYLNFYLSLKPSIMASLEREIYQNLAIIQECGKLVSATGQPDMVKQVEQLLDGFSRR